MPPKTKKLPTTSPEHEADQREMDRLEVEIAQLRDDNTRLKKQFDDQQARADLWQEYAEGLEARVKISKLDDAKRNKAVLGPMLQGVGGGLLGAALYGIGASMFKDAKPTRKGPGDYEIK